MTLAVEEVAVLTAASMVMWRESAVAAAAVALGGLEVAAVVEVTASIVGSKGTSLGNVLAVQLLDS